LACCENIRIIGCTIDKSERYPAPLNAIGTHSQPNSTEKSKNIIIAGNVAKGSGGIGAYGFFVNCVNFQNVKIIDNLVEGYTRFVRIYSNKTEFKADGTKITDGTNSYCDNIQIAGNTITLYERYMANGVYGISYNGVPHRNIQVMNNIFISNKLDSAKIHYMADFNLVDNVVVTNNTNNMVFDNPVRITDCTSYCVYNNNYFSNL
jgi:hypothetical protein